MPDLPAPRIARPAAGRKAQPKARRRDRRRLLYRLRDSLRRVGWNPRTWRCGTYAASKREVEVRIRDGRAYYSGLRVCGSVWSCPVCGAAIRSRRAEQVHAMICAHRARGGHVYFLTLTTRHHHVRLAELRDQVGHAWRRIFSGRRWVRDRADYSIRHYSRVWDVTYGLHGWHPHFHALLYTTRELTAGELLELRHRMFVRWEKYFSSIGASLPLEEVAVHIEAIQGHAVADYMAKISGASVELARGDLKRARAGGRAPLEILADFRRTGDCADLDLYREYERAMHARRFIQHSRGAVRELLGEDEATDEELAQEEDVGGEPILSFSREEWAALVLVGDRCRMLEYAEAAGAEACGAYITECLARARLRAPP